MNIGERIRQTRQSKGLLIRELAAAMHAGEAYLSNVETGRIRPGAERLADFARALGVSADFLLGLSDEMGQPGPELAGVAGGGVAPAQAGRRAG